MAESTAGGKKKWLSGLTPLLDKIKPILENLASLGSGPTCVGLSIGTSSIKLVELKKAGKTWKLLHFGIVQLPEDAVVNREIINPVAVVDAIKSLLAQIKLKNKSVCTSLSGTSLILKRMALDVPNLKELQEQVFWEAEQYLPFDVSEVVMDFQVLSRSKDNQTDVMFVAAKTTVLDAYMGCVQDAGLKPKIVDVDFFALQNAYEANYVPNPQEAVALVDLGASSLKMTVVHNGIPVFTKDSAMGGKNLTVEIQKHLNLGYTDAEALKSSGQAEGVPQEISELTHVMCENFATEVKRSIDFYHASSTGAPIVSVLISGGSAKMNDLSRIVEETTGLPCQILNPFNSIAYDPAVFTPEYIAAIAPVASIPIGLALRAGASK